jgi:acetyltransferase-like isoleucine patch superfamily enzyme
MRRRFDGLFAECRRFLFRGLWGMDIGRNCRIALSARLDKTYPRGVHIGDGTAVHAGASILTHDFPRQICADTWVGQECDIGARSLIMPGIRIGDHCVVAPASVVFKDVPANCHVAGNPARVVETRPKPGALDAGDPSPRQA